jgi:hypothetical protein
MMRELETTIIQKRATEPEDLHDAVGFLPTIRTARPIASASEQLEEG